MQPGSPSLSVSVSFTVTENVHVSVFPWPSVAVMVTSVVPTEKNVPLAGVLTTLALQFSKSK